MNNIVKIIVFNTLTNELQEVYVTQEVAQTFKRTGWNIKDNDKSFFKHEIQISGLIGGQNNAYENFKEFVSGTNDMHEAVEKQLLIEKLHNALKGLNETDYKIIYLLFHDCLSERECAEKIGVSQSVLHRKKHRILKYLKKFLN